MAAERGCAIAISTTHEKDKFLGLSLGLAPREPLCGTAPACALAASLALGLWTGPHSSAMTRLAHLHGLTVDNLNGPARKWCGVSGKDHGRVSATLRFVSSGSPWSGTLSIIIGGARMRSDALQARELFHLRGIAPAQDIQAHVNGSITRDGCAGFPHPAPPEGGASAAAPLLITLHSVLSEQKSP